MRLDGLSILFLEARLLAQFEDWQGLVDMPNFANLVRARKTPGMASVLLSALYHVNIKIAYQGAELQPLLDRYTDSVRALALPMLFASSVKSMGPEAVRVFALEVLSDKSRGELRDAVATRTTELGWLASHIEPAPIPARTAITNPLDTVRKALIDGTLVDDIATTEILRRAFAQLGPG